MSCRRARRELLEHFALGEELGPRSGPHLAHLESCADCRREVGIDREVVENLRRALRERVKGGAPSEVSWELVRSRTVDRPLRPWTVRVQHWGGMVAAAAAASIMLFAIGTAPETRLFPEAQSPFVVSAARRAVPPVEDPSAAQVYRASYVAPQTDLPLPGQRMQMKLGDGAASPDSDPPSPGLR